VSASNMPLSWSMCRFLRTRVTGEGAAHREVLSRPASEANNQA
jgi:hypothetical protein